MAQLGYIAKPTIERIVATVGDHTIIGLCAELVHANKIDSAHNLVLLIQDKNADDANISFQMHEARLMFPLLHITGYRRTPDDAWQNVPDTN